MSAVFYRSPGHDYPQAVRANGVYLWDAEGRRYLDGSGGAAISTLGHGHPAVIAAVKAQLDQLAFAHTQFFTNAPQEALAQSLSAHFPEPGARSYFLAGGSEANEAAIKLAHEYHRARGETRRHLIISRRQSYHGNTLGALSVTGHRKRRSHYEALLHQWPQVSPCFGYRRQPADLSDRELVTELATELDATILSAGAEQVAAFMAETVVGASLGAVCALPGYWQAMREVCDRHGVLLILDEVMSGSGRTGSWFAFEQEQVLPDMVTLAKGLGGGYQPLAAMLVREHVHATIAAADGFAHGHSYVGHATACAAGLAVLHTIENEDLLARVKKRGDTLRTRLKQAFDDHPQVGDIRGRGLFQALELVLDRDSRRPPPAAWQLPARLRQAAMEAGLICYPGGGTADGRDGVHILLAPPFIVSNEQLDELVDALNTTLIAVPLRAPT